VVATPFAEGRAGSVTGWGPVAPLR
jgi:hypothetical protein